MLGIKDRILRYFAKSWLLNWVDGYKTTIFRIVQTVNAILAALYVACPVLADLNGMAACAYVDDLNAKWLALSLLLGQLGLEFGIQDAKAKKRELGYNV